jgi:transcriptional regulator with XRE-family HTH domain
MEATPGKRVQQLREAKGYKSLTAFAEYTGLKVGTLSALEADKSAPSFETMRCLAEKFPDLNPDWLLLGTGPMLRDGKVLTPAPVAAPASEVPVGYGANVELAINRALLSDRDRLLEQQRVEIARLNRELGKPSGGFDAATPTPAPAAPTPIGFRLSVSSRVRHRGAANLS